MSNNIILVISNTNTLAIVTAFSTIIIGLTTCFIAFSQMRIAGAKVKFDLYERRFNVYMAASNCYLGFYKTQPEEIDYLTKELIKSWRESQFLFKESDGIRRILKEMQQDSNTNCSYRNYMNGRIKGDNTFFDDFLQEKANYDAAKTRFEKNLDNLEEKIKPYIHFKSIQGWTFLK